MLAIVQYLLMVGAALLAIWLAHDAWQYFQADRAIQATFAMILAVFQAGSAVLMGISMTEEAERNYSKRQRKE